MHILRSLSYQKSLTHAPQDELASCFIYQVGALMGFLVAHGLTLNHVSAFHLSCSKEANEYSSWGHILQIKPHGAVYGMTARDPALARAAVGVAKTFGVPFMGLPGTQHQAAAKELGVPFIAGKPLFSTACA